MPICIIVGYVWQILGKGCLFSPYPIREQPRECPSSIGLKLTSWFYEKYSIQTFNCKSVSQKVLKLDLLSSFASQNILVTSFRFVSSVFSLCIESSIQWFNLSCDMVLLTQFLMWHIGEADLLPTAFDADGTRYNFNKAIFSG